MNKSDFCKCAKVLQDYSIWEHKLYECGMNLDGSPAGEMAEALHYLICDGNPDWSYDTKLGFDWIIEWCFGEAQWTQRHNIDFFLDTPGALYEFLLFMNEHGWEDE